MNILNKLTIRSLKLNRKRTVVTIIGIILSAAMICGVATIAASFQDLFIQAAVETDGNYHATFHDVSMENVKYLVDSAYTKAGMLSRDLGYARLDRSPNENRPYLLIKEYDAAALQNMPVKLIEGRFPEKTGEIMISEEVGRSGDEAYRVGQTLILNLGRRIAEDGALLTQHHRYDETEIFESDATENYKVTGIIAKPRFEPPRAPGYTAIAYLEQGSLTAADTVNVSILANNPGDIYEQAPELARNAGADRFIYNNELLRWYGVTANNRAKDFINNVSLIVILLIVVGSVAVIYNAFAISVSERKKQFGMLAGVGTTPKQIRKTVFFEGVILGLLGLPSGILAGIFGIGVTLGVINRLMIQSMFGENVVLRLVVTPGTILVTALFVTLIIFLSAHIPAVQASRTSPIDAVRQSTEIKITGKKLKTSRLTRLLFGIGGELALKNLKRNRAKYRATVFSLFISIVLFVSISSFITYGFRSAGLYYEAVPYDVAVALYDKTFEEQNAFFSQITALEDVGRYAVVRAIYCYAEGLERTRVGVYTQQLLPADEEGRYRVTFNLVSAGEAEFNRYAAENGLDPAEYQDTEHFKGILVNQSVTQERDGKYVDYEPVKMKANDKVTLVEHSYDDGHEPVSFAMEIGAVTGSHPLGVSYANPGSVNVVVSEAVFEAIRLLLHEYNRIVGNFAQLYVQSGNSTKLVEQIHRIGSDIGPTGADTAEPLLYVGDIAAMNEEVRRTRTLVSIFLYGFVTLISLIGVTNIFNTISTNVALRRREFAVLKSVGLTPQGLNRMINYESIFYGLKALLYGLPVSILISYWLHNAFGHVFEFTFILPWKEIAACIIAVLLIVFTTMLHASARLKKENIIDALKEENL